MVAAATTKPKKGDWRIPTVGGPLGRRRGGYLYLPMPGDARPSSETLPSSVPFPGGRYERAFNPENPQAPWVYRWAPS